MVELYAGGYIGRIHNTVGNAGVIVDVGTSIHQPPICGIHISLGGVIRPTIIPSDSRSVRRVIPVAFIGRPVIVCLTKKRATTCVCASLPVSRRLRDLGTALRRSRTGPPHNVRLLSVRAGNIDVDVADKGVFHVDFHVVDIVNTFHFGVFTVVGESQCGSVGAAIGSAGDTIGEEGGVCDGERGLYVEHLYLTASVVTALNQIILSCTHLGNLNGFNKVLYG